eukprot:m.428781 g.428781  ORF g.428781 m.428781 type:complete len:75 (+) comp21382_c0_seq9:628-852(+)
MYRTPEVLHTQPNDRGESSTSPHERHDARKVSIFVFAKDGCGTNGTAAEVGSSRFTTYGGVGCQDKLFGQCFCS